MTAGPAGRARAPRAAVALAVVPWLLAMGAVATGLVFLALPDGPVAPPGFGSVASWSAWFGARAWKLGAGLALSFALLLFPTGRLPPGGARRGGAVAPARARPRHGRAGTRDWHGTARAPPWRPPACGHRRTSPTSTGGSPS